MRSATYCLSLGVVLMMSQGAGNPSCDAMLPALHSLGMPVGAGVGPFPSTPMQHCAANRLDASKTVDRSTRVTIAPVCPVRSRKHDPVRNLKRIFLQEGIPGELVWIAEVESAMNPRARSRAGAVGLFQLTSETAGRFGLRTGLRDERLHPEKSARAAARYLKILHREFGSWPLAIAAYNAGEGRVERALDYRGVSSFEEVAAFLPAETRSYVPRVMAIVADREGISPDALPEPSRGS